MADYIWECCEYRLEMSRHHFDGSRWYMSYFFFDMSYPEGEQLIFSGNDFGCTPMYVPESMDNACQLLGFLSLRKGDTDEEFFKNYTPKQLEWIDSNAEDLAMIVADLEESLTSKS